MRKTGGMWYSTTRAGWCGAPDADPKTCTWNAVVEKVVNKSCSDNLIYEAIEAYDHASGAKCFEACPSRKQHPFRARNTSDVCWIYCFYQTVVGASAMLPSGGEIGGMPLDRIRAAFDAPFKPPAKGGCPALTLLQRTGGRLEALSARRQAATMSSYMRHRAEMADTMWREASRPDA